MMTIFVGNLPNDISAERARVLFSAYGKVESVDLIRSESNRRHQGYGFVEMDENAAAKAIAGLDGSVFEGALLCVREATEVQLAKHRESDGEGDGASDADDIPPSNLLRRTYDVASIEKVPDPAGEGADDWYRYELRSGPASITGFHRGSLEQVTQYASECADAFNERNLRGSSTRRTSPAKKG